MADGETIRTVLAYEDSDRWTDVILEGAEQAGWDAQVFRNPYDVVGNACGGVGALITTLGIREAGRNWRFPGEIVTKFSDTHNIPRAVFTAHPIGREFVRHGKSDIFVPKQPSLKSEVFSKWFQKLASV